MRAKKEYDKWCALERMHEESRFGAMQQKAYIAGFNKAIELVEQSLRGEVNEQTKYISQTTSHRERTAQITVPVCRGN
jgi:uncharacterized membrane protein YgcG